MNRNSSPKVLARSVIQVGAAMILISGMVWLSCTREEWEDHYNPMEAEADMNLWDAVKQEPRYSKFVEYMETYQLDSLFELEQFYTLFIPDNDAFESITDTVGSLDFILVNHISRTVFLTSDLAEARKLQFQKTTFRIYVRPTETYLHRLRFLP